MSDPLLISTDFDGTLIPLLPSEQADTAFARPFMERLLKLRKQRKIVWIINTGRNWDSLRQTLYDENAEMFPDWVVTVERFAHRVENRRLFDLAPWNQTCEEDHHTLFQEVAPIFERLRKACAHLRDLAMVRDIGSPLGFIASDMSQAELLEEICLEHTQEHPDLELVRNTIYFRFGHRKYTKGSALQAIARELGLRARDCFAIGDHANDIPMLDKAVAHHLACPGNASDSVKKRVRDQGGYLARAEAAIGVAEALDHFFGLELGGG